MTRRIIPTEPDKPRPRASGGGPKVVSFINYKGGVGKTTSTYHVGCSLAEHHGKRVLFIDIDPQTNLTFLCAPYEKWKEFKEKNGTIATLYQRFLKHQPLEVHRCIWQTPIHITYGSLPNIDVLPCDLELLGEDLGAASVEGRHTTVEALRANAKEYLRERNFLRSIVAAVRERYDYVLIDCPPNLYLMTQNALLASHHYVVTAIPDHLSTVGLNILADKVTKIGKKIEQVGALAGDEDGPTSVARFGGVIFVKVRLGGTMITNTHRNKMAEVHSLLSTRYPQACFPTWTTELIGYGEAAENSLPVWRNASPNSKKAAQRREYEVITDEFAKRF